MSEELKVVKENPLQDLIDLKYQTSAKSLNVLGISTTNMNAKFKRPSTSELALEKALQVAEKHYSAKTKLLKLRELNFRNCEGYYSMNETACTWPCTISQQDPNDGMNNIYRDMVLWADVVLLATPIRWGQASALYYQMAERLNTVENKTAGFIITGGQDNIQAVAGSLMMFFTELGFSLPPFAFMGWSRGWIAEDTSENVKEFQKSAYIDRSVEDLVHNTVKLSKQIKGQPWDKISSPSPKISEARGKGK
jgi:multimeric flavodoxin WrbA